MHEIIYIINKLYLETELMFIAHHKINRSEWELNNLSLDRKDHLHLHQQTIVFFYFSLVGIVCTIILLKNTTGKVNIK